MVDGGSAGLLPEWGLGAGSGPGGDPDPVGSRNLLAAATTGLAAAGVPSPAVDAALLLEHVTGRRRHELRLGVPVSPRDVERFGELVELRCSRLPLQHLTGTAPFRHLELAVGPGVFIPRPETELLVDVVLDLRSGLPGIPAPLVVDLCTGSGALALSVATEVSGSQVVAVELSEHALAWAQRNLADHQAAIAAAGSQVELLAGDATVVAQASGTLAHMQGTVDVVLCNPPYIPRGAVPRDPEVRDHDPELALYGGPDGLGVVRPLLGQAALLLRPGGSLVMEHADEQGEHAARAGLPALLRAARGTNDAPLWDDVVDHHDLTGRPRCTSARRTNARLTEVRGTDAGRTGARGTGARSTGARGLEAQPPLQ